MQSQIQARVAAIIAEATLIPCERLVPEARTEALGIDSLGLVESIFALEEAFGIKVPFGSDTAAAGLDVTTIGSIAAGIEALLVQARAA